MFDYDEEHKLELDADRLSWDLNSCCRLAKTKRDAGGWLDTNDLVEHIRHCASWVELSHMSSIPELIMLLASKMDDKMGSVPGCLSAHDRCGEERRDGVSTLVLP